VEPDAAWSVSYLAGCVFDRLALHFGLVIRLDPPRRASTTKGTPA